MGIYILNILAALLLGVLIGLERQWRNHPAGLRTNALVSLGAAMFVSLSLLTEQEDSPTRVAAQVVSGLGFLGAGVILREGLNVRGLNTAATLWCSGAVGTLAGSSLLIEAGIGTFAILLVNTGLRPVVQHIDARRRKATDVETYYRLRVVCRESQMGVIRVVLLRHIGTHPRMNIQGMMTEEGEGDHVVVVTDIYTLERNDRYMEELVARISIEPDVISVSWEQGTA